MAGTRENFYDQLKQYMKFTKVPKAAVRAVCGTFFVKRLSNSGFYQHCQVSQFVRINSLNHAGENDAAAVMGLSPFCTKRDLYYDKRNIQPVVIVPIKKMRNICSQTKKPKA